MKWVRLMDIREMPLYRNPKARLLYLHLACSVDIASYTTRKSYRQLARELDMTLAEIRHAMRQLVDGGLVATQSAAQSAAQTATQSAAQTATQVTILIFNEKGAPNGAPNDTPNDTPYDTPYDTPNDTQNNNNNNKNKKNLPTHDRAREALKKSISKIAATMEADVATVEGMVDTFIERQRLKKKAWSDDGDMVAHFISWCEKRLPAAKNRLQKDQEHARSDHEARLLERQRLEEERQRQNSWDRRQEELEKMRRWRLEAIRRGDMRQAELLEEAIRKEGAA